MYLDIKIPHLQIAHQGGNLEMGNIKIHHPEMDSPHNLVTRHRHGTILILLSFTLYSISSMKVVPLLPESAINAK